MAREMNELSCLAAIEAPGGGIRGAKGYTFHMIQRKGRLYRLGAVREHRLDLRTLRANVQFITEPMIKTSRREDAAMKAQNLEDPATFLPIEGGT